MIYIFAALAAGAYLTSFAEYHFRYNLFDYTLDAIAKVKALFKKL